MADIAFVPEGDVLHRGHGVPANDASQAAQSFAGDWVALVRHGRTAFLPFAEELFHFEHLGALQVAKLCRPAIDAGSDDGQRGDKFRVAVALHNLGGERRRLQPELFAHRALDRGIKMRVSPNRAAQLSHPNPFGRLRQPFLRAAKLVVHERHLQ